jgi:PPOX class probable F420-dependent enzyme
MSKQHTSVYPQAQPFTSDEVESFLARPLIAKLCTYNDDGTIHIVPIWFRYENGEILLGTQEVTRKVRNIKRDNRVSVLVDTQEPTLQGVIVHGHAVLDYDDVIPKRISIFEKYLGSEDDPGLAKRLASNWTPVIVRIKPEHIISFDYSKGFGISSDPDAETIEIV